MWTCLTAVIFVAAFSGDALSRGWNVDARDATRVIRTFLISLFEWFGEITLFCGRFIRAGIAPPFLRNCEERTGTTTLWVGLQSKRIARTPRSPT